MRTSLRLAGAAFAGLLLLTGCDYTVPITARPTRPVNARLLGDWISLDPSGKQDAAMSVRPLDESAYAVAIEGDIYRAFHSECAGLPLVSVQDLNSSSRKYVYYAWQLTADGARLTLRRVSLAVIPDSTPDSPAVQRLLAVHASDPKLFEHELVFTRKPPHPL